MRRKKKDPKPPKYPFFDIGSCNSDYGFAWERRWCERCYRDMNKCNIIGYAMAGIDWKHQLVVKDGEDVCLSFKPKDEHVPVPRVSRKQRMAMDAEIDIFNKDKE
jgi:hypothetical protein